VPSNRHGLFDPELRSGSVAKSGNRPVRLKGLFAVGLNEKTKEEDTKKPKALIAWENG